MTYQGQQGQESGHEGPGPADVDPDVGRVVPHLCGVDLVDLGEGAVVRHDDPV